MTPPLPRPVSNAVLMVETDNLYPTFVYDLAFFFYSLFQQNTAMTFILLVIFSYIVKVTWISTWNRVFLTALNVEWLYLAFLFACYAAYPLFWIDNLRPFKLLYTHFTCTVNCYIDNCGIILWTFNVKYYSHSLRSYLLILTSIWSFEATSTSSFEEKKTKQHP